MRLARLYLPLATLLVLVGVLFAACSSSDNKESATQQSNFAGMIKLGVMGDYTGSGATSIAPSLQRGMEVAIKEINDAGGVKVNGQAYSLTLASVVDSRSDSVATIAGTQTMADAGVIAAQVATSYDPQAYQQLKDKKVVMFGASPAVKVAMVNECGADQTCLSSKYTYFFGTNNDNRDIITGHIKMIISQYPQIKNVGFLGDDSILAKTLGDGVQIATQRLGLNFVGRQAAPAGTTDWSTFVTNLKTSSPDLVVTSTGAGFVEATRSSIQLNLAPYILTWLMTPAQVNLLADLGTTTIFGPDWRLPLFPQEGIVPPQYKDAAAKFGILTGGQVLHAGWAQTTYNFVYLLRQAIEKAGTTTDVAAISQALEGQIYTGPFGTIAEKNHLNAGPTGMLVASKAEYRIYTFPEYPSADKNVAPEVTYTQKR